MSDLVPHQQPQHLPSPFQRQGGNLQAINAGAVSIEQERAIAETQGKLILAKRMPRDLNAAHAELMMACKSKAFAAVAFYTKPQGGSTVSGPSIRMAEQIAQVYGNFDYGHRELSRDDTKSEVEVYAWDMEKNNYTRRQKTVMHVRDTRDGPKKLRDQTDVDQKINNVASKEMRGLILAMMPKWLVEDAVQECKKTLAGDNDEPLDVRVRKMTAAFAKFGVKPAHLEKFLGHTLDQVLLDELVDLQGVYNAIRDGAPASEFFNDEEDTKAEATEQAQATVTKARAAAKTTTVKAAAPAPAPEPAAAPAADPEPAAAPAAEAKESKAVKKDVNPVESKSAESEQNKGTHTPPPEDDDVF